MSNDLTSELQQQISEAYAQGTPLQIAGAGTKAFYGRTPHGEPLSRGAHRGRNKYSPNEHVNSAPSCTPLAEIEAELATHNQMLAFEPPHFGAGATLGGTVACGFSGPRRPYAGAARDFVLGTKILNGKGELLRFGGEVMKNVAGYDVARLMTGAMGALGVLLEVSLKVLPRPAVEVTLRKDLDESRALKAMNRWSGLPLPLSAAACDGEHMFIRLSGSTKGVKAAGQKIGGDVLAEDEQIWERLREHRHGFFESATPLWRVSVAPGTAPLALRGKSLLEWNGALRWLKSTDDATSMRTLVERHGGHATLFRGGDRDGQVFHPLPPGLMQIHENLKRAFDPACILNPGRWYTQL
ncbi:MAG: glycolate oxidase subunit GlcE [Pseudomonadota bacterium]|nr:MAG: glycolate oxidase subunit GlcE [Pseudomonadota bacterium]